MPAVRPAHHTTPRARVLRRAVLGLAILALLWAQGLALWHAQAHTSLPAPLAAAVGVEQAPDDHEHGFFESHDEGSAQCRLFDQLAHADLLFASLPVAIAPRVPDPRPAACPASDPVAAAGCSYFARGPPAP